MPPPDTFLWRITYGNQHMIDFAGCRGHPDGVANERAAFVLYGGGQNGNHIQTILAMLATTAASWRPGC